MIGHFAVACRTEPRASPAIALAAHDSSDGEPRDVPAAHGESIEIVPAPPQTPADYAVRQALAGAAASRRTLVVYVGAAWCEPCQRFHQAAESGALDKEFPPVTFLEFDLDRDRTRLAAAGYVSRLIPLFALPAPDGRASGKQVEGGIKGDGAVAFMVPRLREMLAE